ncbi:endonuclease domain-containing protein [Rhizobium sp. SGZ-381]|uniref:endonuclease domain-containing protein n=1 Tax=Rhizobium sp. SGZ-381 TaxID=3342800 RepID=UPI003670BBA0
MRGRRETTTARARALRQVENDGELKLWSQLRNRQLGGCKFVRQLPIGPYFADFACREKLLVVEVDGSQHAGNHRDVVRNAFMGRCGWSVLRFWNVDVLRAMPQVLETVLAVLDGRLIEKVDAYDLRFYPAFEELRGEDCPSP